MVPLITYSTYSIQRSSVTEDQEIILREQVLAYICYTLWLYFPTEGFFPYEEGRFSELEESRNLAKSALMSKRGCQDVQ